ncbi:restriction endonuclease [Pseudomonas citronellolis]|uniref:restriction endonuclease n=1 Tax=Pseudomonas citronellolis TaxID=53408 RepID=UPI0026498C18|nr:restriction endonuclease [Pseudomonas citronellolis]MDN6871851.1 restriction endonuclease [Pseudomonas citronellolis]
MWSFFKKSNTSASSAKAEVCNDISFDEFSDLIRLEFSSRKAYLFYAQLCGYVGETVIEDIESFLKHVYSDPSQISSQGRDFAVYMLFKDLDFTARSWDGSFKSYYKSMLTEPDFARREDFVSRWPKNGLSSLVSNFGLDYKSHIVNYVLSLRDIDNGNIKYKVEDKLSYLKPILRKSLRDGVDKYGEQNYSAYFAECEEFASRFFSDSDLKFYSQDYVWSVVDKIVWPMLECDNENRILNLPEDGVEFEYWCAEQLEVQGWGAIVTKGSGDQGVDIVAQKDGIVVAIQCKRYTGAIGNKAVQEVFAGRTHILADHACIIGTGGFTKSAIELANATDVRLMDASDIAYFDEYYA